MREGEGETRLLTQLAVTGKAPLPAPGTDGTLPPEVLAAGMNAAFAAAMGALENGLVGFIR
jgi:hypothetical protein